jgi:hypothetical protein
MKKGAKLERGELAERQKEAEEMEGGEGSGDDQDTERVTDEHAQPAAAAEAEAEEGGPPRASEPEPPVENRAGGRRVRQRTSDLASVVSGINWGRRA